MAIKAKLYAGVWDLLVCEDCGTSWATVDVDHEWTDEAEHGEIECVACGSQNVVREERG